MVRFKNTKGNIYTAELLFQIKYIWKKTTSQWQGHDPKYLFQIETFFLSFEVVKKTLNIKNYNVSFWEFYTKIIRPINKELEPFGENIKVEIYKTKMWNRRLKKEQTKRDKYWARFVWKRDISVELEKEINEKWNEKNEKWKETERKILENLRNKRGYG